MSFPGVKTSRDGFLVDIDLDPLRGRIADYFDAGLSREEIARRYPSAMNTTARFDASAVRDALLKRGGPDEGGFIRFAYRPFDVRYVYWEADTKLLDEKRADYKRQVFDGNLYLVTQQKPRRAWSPPQVTSQLGCLDLFDRGATCIPVRRREDGWMDGDINLAANLSGRAQRYLDNLDLSVDDLFYHVLAVMHDPDYRDANAGALRMEWPRIPLPGWPDGNGSNSGEALAQSAAKDREIASLLNLDQPVPGVSRYPLHPEIAALAVPATNSGRNMIGDDFALAAGWGHFGASRAVMPGQGRVRQRGYTAEERAEMGEAVAVLGGTTFDVHLNDDAFWCNIPAAVWSYNLGGYQVLKKWLSYRERRVLGRPLKAKEMRYFSEMARRIGSLLLLLHR